MACMVILQVVTHLVAWPSSPSIWVGELLDTPYTTPNLYAVRYANGD